MIIIFDLDGTLANIDHRLPFIQSKPKNWDAFNAAVHLDSPKEVIVDLCTQLYGNERNIIIICSGRNVDTKEETQQWLQKHGVGYHHIFMRPSEDRRADYIVKKEMLDMIRAKYGEVDLVVDDRRSVIEKCWKAEGIQVLQCGWWEEDAENDHTEKEDAA